MFFSTSFMRFLFNFFRLLTMKLYLSLFLFVLLGCTTVDLVKENEANFYPLDRKSKIEYEVVEEYYGILNGKSEKKYYLQEVVGDSVGKIYNVPVFRIERYKRLGLNDSWKIDSVWTSYKLPDRAVKVENNVPMVKLIFPIELGMSWNVNLYNSFRPEYCQLTNSQFSYTVANYSNKAIEITQKYDSSAVILQKKKEIYLSNVGMIYKENTNLNYCQSSTECIGKGKIDSGFRIIYRAINYSK